MPIAECGPRSAEAVGAAMGSTRGAQWHGDRGMCLLQPLPNSKAMPLIALAIVWQGMDSCPYSCPFNHWGVTESLDHNGDSALDLILHLPPASGIN